ncbi:hypothetical protein ACQFX9_14340 [Aliinostoc sp. HNIBRCY26]|uniref:hypothetical protein n=1 Tax=Aliinostoc sp. HNIBRCY26 TaxID=3418997 RepID=UPI003D007699
MNMINSTNLPTSYIDIDDLRECLEEFYSKQLDNVEPYIDRLYRNLIHLHPTNTLWGQLDSATLLSCIKKLGTLYEAAIENYYLDNDKAKQVLQHYYFHKDRIINYDTWVSRLFINALDSLALEVLQVI